jgi:hypothetical protein
MAATQEFVCDSLFNETFALPTEAAVGRAGPCAARYADHRYWKEDQPKVENGFLFFATLLGSGLVHTSNLFLEERSSWPSRMERLG